MRAAGLTDVTLRLYPGGRHECINEQNKQEVWADILAWLEGHIAKEKGGTHTAE